MSKKKNNRKRKTSGWAYTKNYPHKKHPANYKYTNTYSDDIEYLTFTHSSEVDLDNEKISTIPLSDNISPSERLKNKRTNNKKNISYVYPNVFIGKRSSLHKETNEFDPVESDKNLIATLFNTLPKKYVPITGGNGKFKKNKKLRKK